MFPTICVGFVTDPLTDDVCNVKSDSAHSLGVDLNARRATKTTPCPFMSLTHSRSESLVETTAGLTAGFASTIVLHPLDVIKTRLQGERPALTLVCTLC